MTDLNSENIDKNIYTQNLQYYHLYPKHIYEQSITSLSFDDYNQYSLEIVTCGMRKNTQLPVPYENFSLIHGCFGDDAGFTMREGQNNFLGKYKY